MKNNMSANRLFLIWRYYAIGIAVIGLMPCWVARIQAAETTTNNFENIFNNKAAITPEDMIASVDVSSPGKTTSEVSDALQTWDKLSSKWGAQQFGLVRHLIFTLSDPKSPVINKCAAAYYLGEMRSPAAVDALAANITLQYTEPQFPSHKFPNMLPGMYISEMALVYIGNPSIPAMIRNLAESDDVKVREFSLRILYRIENDKDIAQLRLQKALKAENDSQKQARLQSAIKVLDETKF